MKLFFFWPKNICKIFLKTFKLKKKFRVCVGGAGRSTLKSHPGVSDFTQSVDWSLEISFITGPTETKTGRSAFWPCRACNSQLSASLLLLTSAPRLGAAGVHTDQRSFLGFWSVGCPSALFIRLGVLGFLFLFLPSSSQWAARILGAHGLSLTVHWHGGYRIPGCWSSRLDYCTYLPPISPPYKICHF